MIYLFVAMSFLWLAFFLYNWYLLRRIEQLDKELKTLEEFIYEQRDKTKP